MSFEVSLALYDLSGGAAAALSQQFAPLLNGKIIEMIPHTGVRVFEKEYFFGGGVQALEPAVVERTFGRRPERVEVMGRTSKTQAELVTWLGSVSGQWTAASYDLWRNNCNNFSQAVAHFLLGDSVSIPGWILTLPEEVLATPLGGILGPQIGQVTQGLNSNLLSQGGTIGPTTDHGPTETATTVVSTERSVEMMSIAVKGAAAGEGPRRLTVAVDATVGALRSELQVDGGARFVFLGKILSDDTKTLASYGVKDGLQIIMVGAKVTTTTTTTTAPTTTTSTTTTTTTTTTSTTTFVAAIARVELSAGAGAVEALRMISKVCANVINNPSEEKYRTLKLSNAAFQRKVANYAGALDILKLAGFAPVDETLVLRPSAGAWAPLTEARAALDARADMLSNTAPPAMPGIPGMTPGIPGMTPGMMDMMMRAQQGGGMPDMSSMMNDPAIQQMMNSPDAMQHVRETMSNPDAMRRIAETLRANPSLQQAALAQLGQQNPQAAQMMANNPQFQAQMMSMLEDPGQLERVMQQTMGMGPGGPGAGMGFPGMLGMGQQQRPGGAPAPQPPAIFSPPPAAPPPPPNGDNGAMTEEEAMLEAIRRSMSER